MYRFVLSLFFRASWRFAIPSGKICNFQPQIAPQSKLPYQENHPNFTLILLLVTIKSLHFFHRFSELCVWLRSEGNWARVGRLCWQYTECYWWDPAGGLWPLAHLYSDSRLTGLRLCTTGPRVTQPPLEHYTAQIVWNKWNTHTAPNTVTLFRSWLETGN